MPCFMVVGLKSTIASSNFGFQVCQGRRLQTRRWSWRSRNVHDCKFGRPVPWQGGDSTRGCQGPLAGGALFCGLGGLVMFMTAVWAPCTLAGRVGASRGCQGGAGLRPQTPVPPQSPTTEALQANFQNNQPSKQPITQPADKHKMLAFEI